MRSRVLPSSTLPNGHVVETRLTLPARWRSALTNGNPGVLSHSERVIIVTTQELFGYCVDVDDSAPAYCDSHDVIGEGIEPCACLTYTFIDHETQGASA